MSDVSKFTVNGSTVNVKDSTARSDLNNKALKSEAIKNITRSDTTFTATRCDNTTFTFTQKDTTYSDATQSSSGLMSAADKTKLDGVATNANNYSLPTASATTKGGIKVGSNLSMSGDTLNATDTTYSNATQSTAGLMSAADKTKLDGVATNANNYSLPTASATTKGGIKVGSNLSMSGDTLNATDTKTGTTYNAGSVPADTNFGTNGSIKNAYDKNHGDITKIVKSITSNFGGVNTGCNLIYDELNKIVEINAVFSTLTSGQVVVDDYTTIFPLVSSDRILSGVAFGNADGNAWYTQLVIKTNGKIVAQHAVNVGLFNPTYQGRVYVG